MSGHLSGANLSGAYLLDNFLDKFVGICLVKLIDISGYYPANLSGADLSGANLSVQFCLRNLDTNLSDANLVRAI